MRKRIYSVLAVVLGLAFVACDKDFNEIGSDFVGDDHFNLESVTVPLVAYDVKAGAVQSNNLPVNPLGIYNHSVFGKTTASFVTQVQLISGNPSFDENPEVTRVELTVPYFSHRTEFDSETGVTTYKLDSIYGEGKINLKVYESTYYLRDFDPASNFTQAQKYYSDQSVDFDGNHGIQLNDDTSAAQNDEFFFDSAEVLTYRTNSDGEQVIDKRLAPMMKLNLNKDFFQEKIFGSSASGQLVNNNQFQQYFKGLYFKVSHAASNPTGGALSMINFKQGKITIYYKAGEGDERDDEKTFVLNLTGNSVSLLENEDNPTYLAGVTNSDPILGDSRLYLKGGSGSVGVIKIPQEDIDQLKNQNLLINDASIFITVDRTVLPEDAPNPFRIYIYDINKKQPLIDYIADATEFVSKPQKNKYIHDGIYNKASDKYRIRITNHIRDLVDKDSTNVNLGIAITSDIRNYGMMKTRTDNAELNNSVPLTKITDPRGTVVYGSTPEAGENRMYLKIYYTRRSE